MKYCERIYSEAEIKLIKEIFDMYINQLYDDNLEELVLQCKEMFLEHQKTLKEIKRLNKIRQQVIDELFELKDMIYKPETREINFDVQRKISSMIVKLGSDKE